MTVSELIDRAEMFLRSFGAETRVYAEQALPLWSRYDQLTPEQRAEVLDRIEPASDPRSDPQHGNSGPGGPVFPGDLQ